MIIDSKWIEHIMNKRQFLLQNFVIFYFYIKN